MDRIWDTSKYPLKPLMILGQNKVIQRHEVKKVKTKILGSGGVVQTAKSDFRQERKKMTLEHFFEWPKWDKIWKWKNAKIL